MNFKKESGKRIRAARANLDGGRGVTLDELSRRTNGVLSASRISNYEQGLRLPKPQDALILGQALGVTAGHLMCLGGTRICFQKKTSCCGTGGPYPKTSEINTPVGFKPLPWSTGMPFQTKK